ncbi:MAG: hypothetical protein U0T83_10570 [Bacteriovoracaceae bacterium]
MVNANLDLNKMSYEALENIYFEFTGFVDAYHFLEKITKNNHLILLGDNNNHILTSSLSLFLKSLKKELNTFNAKLIIVENFLKPICLKIIQKRG